ncbi:MAG: hypothetical protein PHU93_04805, partial [Candidatus Gracilibacteria bacterium]|nr:hypothetical protein [Candidatus Gracilibacteria bacterium]
YLDVLNRELDYIAPALDFKLGFLEARQIDVDFRNGSISRRAFETTYKNSLSKTAFFGEIEDKTGACVLIDVKGMFIKNCNAFMKLSDEIAEKETKVSILDRLDVLGNITRSFIRGTDEINGYYPNILCTHGGDEFMFFIEHAKASSLPDILKQARDSLGNEGFDIRASARLGFGSKEIFNALDGETKIAKIVEAIGRLPNGSTPSFLRHIEVSAESFSPDYIVSELQRRRKFVEFALSNIANDTEICNFIELRGLKIKIEKTGGDSIRIQALPIESNPL